MNLRSMDVVIAREVLKNRVIFMSVQREDRGYYNAPDSPQMTDSRTGKTCLLPFFSTDINDAFLLVGWMADRGHSIVVRADHLRTYANAKRYTAYFMNSDKPGRGDSNSPAEAICLLILKTWNLLEGYINEF